MVPKYVECVSPMMNLMMVKLYKMVRLEFTPEI